MSAILFERIDSDSITALLNMVESRAAHFLRCGSLVDNDGEGARPLTPTQRGQIARMFAKQAQQGGADLRAIASAVGCSYNTVVTHTRPFRAAAVRRRRCGV